MSGILELNSSSRQTQGEEGGGRGRGESFGKGTEDSEHKDHWGLALKPGYSHLE